MIIGIRSNKGRELQGREFVCAPGKLTAAVRGPTRAIPTQVDDQRDGRPILHFTPEEEGEHEKNYTDQNVNV